MENQFDLKADSWDENVQRVDRAKLIAHKIIEVVSLKSTMRALEYGCGTGLLGFNLISLVEHLTFCDTSAGMLNQVEKKIAHYKYNNASVINADFSESTSFSSEFDLLFTMLTLHHVVNTELIVKNFAKALLPNGYLCIVDLVEEDGSFHNDDSIPHFGFSKQCIEDAVRAAGLTMRHYKIATSIEKETESGTKSFDVFMAIAQKG